MTIYQPYTYLIGWSALDRWYYGCEYASLTKTANPANFWTSYFTSSKIVAALREEHGEPNVIQVRRVFDNAEDCIAWEKKVHRRLDVLHNERWLNANVAGASIQTEEVRRKKGEKISETKRLNPTPAWNKGLNKNTDARIAAVSEATRGIAKTEEHKAALRKPKSDTSKMGKNKSEAHRKNLSIAVSKLMTPERRRQMSEKAKANRRQCVYCGMESTKGNVTRHEQRCSKS